MLELDIEQLRPLFENLSATDVQGLIQAIVDEASQLSFVFLTKANASATPNAEQVLERISIVEGPRPAPPVISEGAVAVSTVTSSQSISQSVQTTVLLDLSTTPLQLSEPVLDLSSEGDLLASADLAASLLTGAKPQANLLSQGGRQASPVATLLFSDAGSRQPGLADGSATKQVGIPVLPGVIGDAEKEWSDEMIGFDLGSLVLLPLWLAVPPRPRQPEPSLPVRRRPSNRP